MSKIKIASHSFLVQNFHEFFNLLLCQKELALRANEGIDPSILVKKKEKPEIPETEIQEGEPEIETLEAATAREEAKKEGGQRTESKDNSLVDTIQRRLGVLLEEQALRSTIQAGEFAVSSYQEALYAMVAFADEIFLNIPWSGQKRWENNLLESRFFQTQIAGELLFKKIDDLIYTNDPLKADLAIIYLLILGLGFKGKYRAEDASPETLALYRQQLYTMLNRHPSTLYDSGRDHLIESCYEHVLTSRISKGLPEIRMWFLVFMSILGIYLFASTVLWYNLVKDMDSSISNILYQAHQMGIS